MTSVIRKIGSKYSAATSGFGLSQSFVAVVNPSEMEFTGQRIGTRTKIVTPLQQPSDVTMQVEHHLPHATKTAISALRTDLRGVISAAQGLKVR